ncbi:MAG: hypothetical protein BWY78_00166 [Alphaproteobacteria bacterium ADurb.Bin438]|nr:MAG: hypothetical protein BWY78_00166 [Alphaproteobacteria bacterium ADurb.Bin438]
MENIVCFPLSCDESEKILNIALPLISKIKNFTPLVALHHSSPMIETFLKENNIKYKIIGIERKVFPKENFLKNLFISYIASPKVSDFLDKINPSIVHSFDISTSITWNSAVKMNNKKIVFSQSSKWDYNQSMQEVIKMADAIISPLNTMYETLPLSLKQNAKVIYPFLREENEKINLRQEFNLSDDDLIIGIKSSDKTKVFVLAEKIQEAFNKKIVFLMKGKSSFELTEEKYKIIGRPYKEFPCGCDAFVIYNYEDNAFFDTRRAFKNNVPVFALRNDINLELIEDGDTGFLINYENPCDFAKRLCKLWSAKDSVAKIALKQQNTTIDDYAKKIESIYEEILK